MKLNFGKKQRRYLAGLFIVLLAGIFGINLKDIRTIEPIRFTSEPKFNPSLSNRIYESKVVSVIDGDTIMIEGKQKVRYIGVNTPEIYKDTTGKKTGEQCFAKEALQENKRLVEGKTVRLERDVSDKDKYGRLLRYVYVDGVFVNEHLVANGFAKTMTVKPDVKYYEDFKERQSSAKKYNLGIWKACPTSTPRSPR